MRYRDKHVIVTGGLGFIGSNLSLRLVEEGARVTIFDSTVQGCGANRHNLAPAGGRINVLVRDIGQAEEVPALLATANVIFNLAGEISHVRSMKDPVRDMKLNTVSQLHFLEACATMFRAYAWFTREQGRFTACPATCRWMNCTPWSPLISTAFTRRPRISITACSPGPGHWMPA